MHTLTLDPINAGIAHIIANNHINAAIKTVTNVVRLPVIPVNISKYINDFTISTSKSNQK